jgi:hypothetical protein
MKIIPFPPRNLDTERQRLINTAMQFGLQDERTIRQSWIVDDLVVEQQRRQMVRQGRKIGVITQ